MSKRRGRDEGSIWQREGKWRCAAIIDGKRIYKSFNTKTECKDYLRSVLELGKKGWRPTTSNILFKDYIVEWLENKKINIKPNTAISYTYCVNKYIIPLLGNYKLSELDKPRIESAYRKIDVAPGSKKVIHAVIYSSLSDATQNGILHTNPSERIKIVNSKKEMKILDEKQVKIFLDQAKSDKFWLFFRLAIIIGARISEILALERNDIDFEKKTIRISKQVQFHVGVKRYTTTTKTGKGRTIQIGNNTIEDILEYIELNNIHDGLIFRNDSGEYVPPITIRYHFKHILKECGLPEIRIHDLRHTSASIMLNHNVPIPIVSEILGHTSIKTTLDVYGHAIPSAQHKATEVMDDI